MSIVWGLSSLIQLTFCNSGNFSGQFLYQLNPGPGLFNWNQGEHYKMHVVSIFLDFNYSNLLKPCLNPYNLNFSPLQSLRSVQSGILAQLEGPDNINEWGHGHTAHSLSECDSGGSRDFPTKQWMYGLLANSSLETPDMISTSRPRVWERERERDNVTPNKMTRLSVSTLALYNLIKQVPGWSFM